MTHDRGLWVTTLTLKRVRLCFLKSERKPQPTSYALTALAVAIASLPEAPQDSCTAVGGGMDRRIDVGKASHIISGYTGMMLTVDG